MSEIDHISPEHEALLEKRVHWKLDAYVLLPIALLYCVSFAEKPNIAYASIAGLIQDLDLRGTQFNNVIAVWFATLTIAAIPSTTLLKKTKPNVKISYARNGSVTEFAKRMIGFLAGGWGIAIMVTGLLVKNYAGLVAARLILGCLDGGFSPAIALYLSMVYKRYELQSRIAICYAAGSVVGLFGAMFAGAIVTLDGRNHIAGWRWIFIIEGIIMIVIAIVNFSVLPANTATAWFFTEREREYATWRLGQDTITHRTIEAKDTLHVNNGFKATGSNSQVDTEEEAFEWREIWRGIFDIQTWLTGLAMFLNMATIFSVSFFMPTIIVGLGYSGIQAQLHIVPTYVLTVVLIVVVAFLGDRLKLRGPFALCILPLSMLGYIIMIASKSNATRYAGACFLIAGTNSTIPSLMAIVANNSKGHYKRASAMALQATLANISGIPGTYIYTLDQQPRFIRGHCICLALVMISWILIAANVLYCIWENKARREGRRNGNIEKYQALLDAGKTKAPIGDRDPDFLFVL